MEYGPGNINKFNVLDKPCTFEKLKCNIQARINSLKDKAFGMQYSTMMQTRYKQLVTRALLKHNGAPSLLLDLLCVGSK